MHPKLVQSCLTLCKSMDCSLPGSSIHGILQARILEWVAVSSSRRSSQPRDQTCSLMVPALASRSFTTKATWEAPYICVFVVVQLLSCGWLFVTPWTAAHRTSLSFIISRSLLKLISIQSVVPSNHLILCRPLLLLPSVFPSIRVFFQWVNSLHQVATVLEVQLQHQSFQWIFRIDFL